MTLDSDVRQRYVRLCRLARVPHEYWFDKKWRRAQPRYLKSTTPYHEGNYVRLKEAEQDHWLHKLSRSTAWLRQAYFIALLGDHSPQLANRVAFGLLCMALRDGLTGRAFPASAVNVPPPRELASLDLDVALTWQTLCLYGAHTDDSPERRQALRDFLQFHDRATRLLVIHGHDPLTYLHTKLGVNPQAVFYLPGERLHLFRLDTESL